MKALYCLATTISLALLLQGDGVSGNCVSHVSCDFEHNNACGFSGTEEDMGHSFWMRLNYVFGIPRRNNNGYFVVLKRGFRDSSKTHDLTSPPICGTGSITVSFSYVVVKPDGSLQLMTRCGGQDKVVKTYTYSSYDTKHWTTVNATVPACTNSAETVVVLRGIFGYADKVAALDDVKLQSSGVTTRPTKSTTLPSTSARTTRRSTTSAVPKTTGKEVPGKCMSHVTCGFEHNACGFSGTEENMGHHFWMRLNQVYGIPNHNSGYFIVLKRSFADSSKTHDLTSPPICGPGSITVSFSYVIAKSDSSLQLMTRCGSQDKVVKTYSYDAKHWTTANVTVPACTNSAETVVILRGKFGYDDKPVAMDDIKIKAAKPATTPQTTIPSTSRTTTPPKTTPTTTTPSTTTPTTTTPPTTTPKTTPPTTTPSTTTPPTTTPPTTTPTTTTPTTTTPTTTPTTTTPPTTTPPTTTPTTTTPSTTTPTTTTPPTTTPTTTTHTTTTPTTTTTSTTPSTTTPITTTPSTTSPTTTTPPITTPPTTPPTTTPPTTTPTTTPPTTTPPTTTPPITTPPTTPPTTTPPTTTPTSTPPTTTPPTTTPTTTTPPTTTPTPTTTTPTTTTPPTTTRTTTAPTTTTPTTTTPTTTTPSTTTPTTATPSKTTPTTTTPTPTTTTPPTTTPPTTTPTTTTPPTTTPPTTTPPTTTPSTTTPSTTTPSTTGTISTTSLPTTTVSKTTTVPTTTGKGVSDKCMSHVTCDFERNACGFSGTEKDMGHHFWIRLNQVYGIPSHNSGYFVVLKRSFKNSSKTHDLTSPPICGPGSITVSFSYVIVKSDSSLQLMTRCGGQDKVVKTYSYDAKHWTTANVTVPACTNSAETVVILRGTFGYGDNPIAVDDLKIDEATSTPVPITTLASTTATTLKTSLTTKGASGTSTGGTPSTPPTVSSTPKRTASSTPTETSAPTSTSKLSSLPWRTTPATPETTSGSLSSPPPPPSSSTSARHVTSTSAATTEKPALPSTPRTTGDPLNEATKGGDSDSKQTYIIVGCVIGAVALVIITSALYLRFRRNRHHSTVLNDDVTMDEMKNPPPVV